MRTGILAAVAALGLAACTTIAGDGVGPPPSQRQVDLMVGELRALLLEGAQRGLGVSCATPAPPVTCVPRGAQGDVSMTGAWAAQQTLLSPPVTSVEFVRADQAKAALRQRLRG